MLKNIILLLILLIASVFTQTPCSPDDPFKGIDQRYKIRPVEPNGKGVKRLIGGTVTIIDGCKFSVNNLTLSPSGGATYWYGIPKGQNLDNLFPRVVAASLGTYGGQDNINFVLKGASWREMDGLAIYSEADSKMYGHFLWEADKNNDESGAGSMKLSFVAVMLAVVIGRAL